MNTSNPHQLTQQSTTEPTVGSRSERAQRQAREAPERSKRSAGNYLRLRPIREASQEAKHVYELERAGESEWTPWIAIAALILFYAAIGLLMFGVIEAGSRLLASASF